MLRHGTAQAAGLWRRGFVDLAPLAQRGGFQQQSLEELSGMLLGHTWGGPQRPTSGDPECQDGRTDSPRAQCLGTQAWAVREIAVKLAPLWLPL